MKKNSRNRAKRFIRLISDQVNPHTVVILNFRWYNVNNPKLASFEGYIHNFRQLDFADLHKWHFS